MRVSTLTRLAVFAFLTVSLSCWGQSRALTLEEILHRMQTAEAESRDPNVAYTVTREYQLSAQGARQPSSQVVAEVSFVPPAAKEYVIVKSEGSDRGAGIVRKVLEHETQMSRHSEQHELTSRNYDFALLGQETIAGHDCYVLQLLPKRQAVELVRGRMWVDAGNFAVRRIEGETAKSPSMWIKDVRVTVEFGQVNGVWLQTSTRAVAEVRFVGPHVLTSRELDVRTAEVSAQAQSTSRLRWQRAGRRHTSADTATWLAR